MSYFILKKKAHDAAGKKGQYIQFSAKVGIKVIGFQGCKTIKHLMLSTGWLKAQEEAYWLNVVNSINLAPRSHGVYPVKFKGKFYAGIFMDHIDGDSLNLLVEGLDFKRGCKVYVNSKGNISKTKKGIPIIKYLRQQLDRLKIKHWDIHGENVLIDKKTKKVWLIDFSSDYIKKKKR